MPISSNVDPNPTNTEQIIVHRLREQGWTDEGTASIHFLKVDISRPFEDWPVSWDARCGPSNASLPRAYAFLKVLRRLDDLGPGNEAAGYRHVTAMIAEPFLALGLKRRTSQARIAGLPRGKLPDGARMGEVIHRLANGAEYRDLTAKELWPHFQSALEELGLEPKELNADDPKRACVQYTPNGDRNDSAQMTLRTFGNRISKARKPQTRSQQPG